jgi:hypothetical protein
MLLRLFGVKHTEIIGLSPIRSFAASTRSHHWRLTFEMNFLFFFDASEISGLEHNSEFNLRRNIPAKSMYWESLTLIGIFGTSTNAFF